MYISVCVCVCVCVGVCVGVGVFKCMLYVCQCKGCLRSRGRQFPEEKGYGRRGRRGGGVKPADLHAKPTGCITGEQWNEREIAQGNSGEQRRHEVFGF